MKLLLLLLLLPGCASVDTPQALGGAVGGVALTKTVEKIREVFTPKYLLQVNPQEICDITSDPVICYILPCHGVLEDECKTYNPREKFFKDNPKVIKVSTSSVVEILAFCQYNPKACEKHTGIYRNQKVVIVKED